ncbi:MAG: HEAT repeat domain-containing protein, partial [Gemmataceae bacterium]|nr:HEAT repeat domain-containing protein [Gemmataceae bacterium]
MSAARLTVVLFAGLTAPGVLAQPPADPVYDGKKASEWVSVLQNDASARKRALAVAALAEVWTQHQYKDALPNIGRSLRVDSSPAVRRQAAVSIAGLKAESARAIENEIVEGLKAEKDARVRKELAVALGRFPDLAKKAVGPLAAVLGDNDPAARAAAADALAKAGPDAKDAAPALLDRL